MLAWTNLLCEKSDLDYTEADEKLEFYMKVVVGVFVNYWLYLNYGLIVITFIWMLGREIAE